MSAGPTSAVPRLSVVVPTRDRPRQLRDCLAALGRSEAASSLEVVVADDGGGVDPAAAREAGGEALEVRIVEAGRRGPAAARNAGAARARAALLAFVDDDCEPEPGWAAALLAAHDAAPTALLGGRTVNRLPANPYSRAAQAITDAALAHHNGGPGGPRFFPSSNVAAPAGQFRELGGFDERIAQAGGEDRDLCERWRERGWPLRAEPRAVVGHRHRLALGSFWRQQAAYGAGAHRHRSRRAARTGRRRLEPSLTSGIFANAIRDAIGSRDFARLVLLGVWQAANLYGFARAAIRDRGDRGVDLRTAG
jgi:GT2 family glycosyltransferase